MPIESAAEPGALLNALERAGRRGRLPGFTRTGDDSFCVDCDAVPFEYLIEGRIEPAPAGSRIALHMRRKPVLPAVFALVLVVTIWPGVWLTDSLLATYWTAYGAWTESMPWLTYAWYLPLTVLPLPWIWLALTSKSRAGAAESARKQREALARIAEEAAASDQTATDA